MPQVHSQNYFQPSPTDFVTNSMVGYDMYQKPEAYNLPQYMLPPPQQSYNHHLHQRNPSYAGLPPPGITHPSRGSNMNINVPGHRGSLIDLPPLIDDKAIHGSRVETQQTAPAPQEEKPSGGVSQNLNYEIKDMAEFVSSKALNIAFPTFTVSDNWRRFVTTILSSTRLPDATILLGLEYLERRIKQSGGQPPKGMNIQKLLTISLVLASKFLDDNTFQNKSWAEVTAIPVLEINKMEQEWLQKMGWNLNIDPKGTESWEKWSQIWKSWKQEQKQLATVKLAPIAAQPHMFDSRSTQMYQQRPPQPLQPPQPRPVSSYHHWNNLNTPTSSPPSAPETGPSTPEYNLAGWPSQYTPLPMPFNVGPSPPRNHFHHNSFAQSTYCWSQPNREPFVMGMYGQAVMG